MSALEATCEDIDGIKFELSNIDDKIKNLKIQAAECQTKLASLEAQLRKNNLCFQGHRENPSDSVNMKYLCILE